MIVQNLDYEVIDGVYCKIHPHHRNGNPNKSQWTVSMCDELWAFVVSRIQGWVGKGQAWALHVVRGNVSVVGVSSDRARDLHLCRFVDPNSNNRWHGFPADYQVRQQDIPPVSVLRQWLGASLISKSAMRKIKQGQPCNL